MDGTPKRLLRVFLCHASQDKRIVRKLADRLKNEGWIDIWLDEKKLLPGQDWRLAIEKAVETSDIVIICLSSNSVSKEGSVQNEVRYARELAFGKPEEAIFLIPLRLDNCDVPRGLRSYQWVDFFGKKQDETYSALLASLKWRYEHISGSEKQERLDQGAEKQTRERADRDVLEPVHAWLEKQRLKAAQRINPAFGWYKKQRITIRLAIIGAALAIVGGIIFGVVEGLKPNSPNAAIVEKPTLSSPANGSGMPQKTEVTLKWNPARGAVQYQVEVWGGRYQKMTPCNWQDATICHIGQMWPGTMYWRVMARDDKGQASQWSDTWSFQIGMIQGYIELVEDLRFSTSSGNWPPQRGDKLIAHIRIRMQANNHFS